MISSHNLSEAATYNTATKSNEQYNFFFSFLPCFVVAQKRDISRLAVYSAGQGCEIHARNCLAHLRVLLVRHILYIIHQRSARLA